MPAVHRKLSSFAVALSICSLAINAVGQDERTPKTDEEVPTESNQTQLKPISVRDYLPQQHIRPPQTQVDMTRASSSTDDQSALFRSLGIGLFAASATDVATTEWGMAQGHKEANPLARSRGVRLTHHVIGPAAVWYTTERLHRSGKRKLALSLRIALMAAYSYAAIHNARTLSQ